MAQGSRRSRGEHARSRREVRRAVLCRAVLGAVAAVVLVGACYEPPASGAFPIGPTVPPPLATDALRLEPADLPPGRTELRFGVAPVLGEAGMRDEYGPLTEYLAESLGVPVTLVVAPSYGELIDAIATDRVDVAVLPPGSYVHARDRAPGLQLLASQIAAGATSYSSYIVVRTHDTARSLDDLVGRRVVFVDELSASGFLVPYAAFLDQGIDPRHAFASVHFAQSHVAAVRDVIEGRADAAGTFSGMLGFASRKAAQPRPDAAAIRILHKAGRVPYDAVCASAALPSSGADKFARALRALTTRSAEGRRVYGGTSNLVSGWGPADPIHYVLLGQVMSRVEAHRHAAPHGGDRAPPR